MEPASGRSLAHTPLAELRQDCQTQRERYKRTHGVTKDSSACDEIVYRALHKDREALCILLEISQEIAGGRSPDQDVREDFKQEVALRLLRRMDRQGERPLTIHSFPEYHAFVNTVVENLAINWYKRTTRQAKLAALEDVEAVLPDTRQPQPDRAVENRQLLEACLDVLPNIERDVFYRRYVLEQKVSEIVEELRPLHPDIDSPQVYDIAANALRRLRRHKGLKTLLKNSGWVVNDHKTSDCE